MGVLKRASPNRLINEKSPYLLQHAYNFVDWLPWSEEALKKAKNDGKPILLSIGYSTCHWCHRLSHESFDDPKTAEVINRNFIPVKVDREERPDVDSYYMTAVQEMTGGGGWPLTVFLTPDLKPFYGGTYYPPVPQYGIPSFMQVLEFVSRVWKERKAEALETGSNMAGVLAAQSGGVAKDPRKDLLEGTYAALAASYDQAHGGFGLAPKFPLPSSVSFMLRYHYRTGSETALSAAVKTLDEMAAGGIRDHVGGGFHRYSTDRVWLVPHFEKMLYDNVLLARVYLEGFQATKTEYFARVAREALVWMDREMKSKEGGFYSAQDADTEQGEGVFYTWKPSEVEEAIGKEEGVEFCRLYGVTNAGNFEGGRSVLHLDPSKSHELRNGDLMEKLYLTRQSRPRPSTDEKILTGWNGLAISAFAFAGAVLKDPGHIKTAEGASDFILNNCLKDGRLVRRFAGGEAGIDGTLEDYAFFIQGLLDLFEYTSRPSRLEAALSLTRTMIDDFYDRGGGGFFTSRTAQPARMKESHDGPTPSGNSVAAMDLLRLSELTGDSTLRTAAEETFRVFGQRLEEQSSGHAYMMAGVDLLLNGMREVVVTSPSYGDAAAMTEVVTGTYAPETFMVVADVNSFRELSRLTPLLEGRGPGAKTVAYLCENFTCKMPTSDPMELKMQLAAGRQGLSGSG